MLMSTLSQALDGGLEAQGGAAQVAGGAGVELAHHGAGQLQGLAGQLHHLKGGLGAALQGLLHGGLAGGLLLVGVLGHGEHGADGVERSVSRSITSTN